MGLPRREVGDRVIRGTCIGSMIGIGSIVVVSDRVTVSSDVQNEEKKSKKSTLSGNFY